MLIKKMLLTTTVLFGLTIVSCRENPEKETTIIRETTTTVQDEDKGLFEKVGDAVDTRVDNEVNEEIRKIEN